MAMARGRGIYRVVWQGQQRHPTSVGSAGDSPVEKPEKTGCPFSRREDHMSDSLVTAIADLEEEDALRLAKERLNSGEDPLTILEDARRAMELVGQRFAAGGDFLPDLVYSGEILSAIAEITKSRMSETVPSKRLAKCVIGTVAGDIHDIGKNIVVFML